MRRALGIPKGSARTTHKALFDMSSNGILVCTDPLVGPLDNKGKGLRVKWNVVQRRLELWVNGCVEQVFELGARPEDVCLAACHAYFVAFERSCRGLEPAVVAA